MTEQEQREIFSKNLINLMASQNRTQADMVRFMNVSKSTVSSWYNGVKLPRMGKVDEICRWLNVKRSDLLDFPHREFEEAAIPIAAEMVRNQILVEIDDALNETGHEQWVQYGRFLSTQAQYKQEDGKRKIVPIIRPTIRHYLTPAAAGYASPVDGEDYEDIPLPADAPASADFCVDISGDSMEPYIKDGSTVYVERDTPLQELDVGVFFLDGDMFIKQFAPSYDGSVYLLSANPRRQDANKTISKNATSTLACYGKVILPHKLPMPIYE